jgi:diaminopimelate epimerase
MAVDGMHEGYILDSGLIRLKMQDTLLPVTINDMYYLHTGSPHSVLFVEDVASYPVVGEGKRIRYLPEFQPGGVNVDFVAVQDKGITIRTYERGVEDETLACGTGVTAVVLTLAALHPELESPVKVQAIGGELSVSFERREDHFSDVWLEGPAKKVFTGMIKLA